MIELKTYAGSNVTPQNDAIMNDTNTLNNGIYYGCNVTIKDATTLHINAGQGIVYGRLFEVLDSDIPVSLSPSGTLLGQLYVHIDLSNIAAPIQILVDTGETLADLEDDPQLNIDSGITDMQLATFTVSTVGMSDLVETFKEVEPIRAVLGDADISAIGDGSVKGAIRTINTRLTYTQSIVGGTSDFSVMDIPESRATSTKTTRLALLDNNIHPLVQLRKNEQTLDEDSVVLFRDMNNGASVQGVYYSDQTVLVWGGGDYSLRHGVAYLNGTIICKVPLAAGETQYHMGRLSVPPIRSINIIGITTGGEVYTGVIDTNGDIYIGLAHNNTIANAGFRINVSYVYK